MAGKFECYKDKAGEFRFRLKSSNGNTILSSEGYKSKASCTNGIESVRTNSQNPDRFVKSVTDDREIPFQPDGQKFSNHWHQPELRVGIRP